jgi:hypothetical protein
MSDAFDGLHRHHLDLDDLDAELLLDRRGAVALVHQAPLRQ